MSKILAAEQLLDAYLNPSVTAIGAPEEDEAIKLMRKLPSGINTKKLYDTLIKLGMGKFYRFGNSFSKEYIPVLQEAMKTLSRDTFYSKMMMHSVIYALDKDFEKEENYTAFLETGAFLQYLDKLQSPVEKPEQFLKSDTYITPAVAEVVHHVLTTIQYTSRDIRVFNSFVYVLGKMNHPDQDKMIEFQVGQGSKLYEMNVIVKALKLHSSASNTAIGYQLIHNKLKAIQNESLAYRFAGSLGLDPEPDLKWSIKIELDSHPDSPNSGFITLEVSNMWNDCIQLLVKGPKGSEKGNERHGILKGKGLDFRKIDLFNLRTELEEIGQLYGLDKLDWKKAKITVTGFEKSAAKEVKRVIGD